MEKKLYSIGLIVSLALLLSFALCCRQYKKEGITEDEAKAITEQVLKIWNEGDLELADQIYAPGYVRHHPTASVNASLDDLKNTVTVNRAGFPDYNLTFDEMILHEDWIIVRAKVTGTNTAPIGERPATGRKIHLSGIYIYRIANKKIAEEWTYFNLLSYYQQLGFTLSPPRVDEAPEKKQ
jgi:C-1 hydroxylase